ncbi:MAG: UDP-glucuronic acid decarboxylase family protein [Acidobacteriota bacterium]
MGDRRCVLITGGAGFIGSHLTHYLLENDFRVIVMDNLLTGDLSNISRFANRDFLFIEHDVTQYLIVGEPLDFILHFASPASPTDYLQHPIHTLKVGALGTHKALGLAKRHGATLVLASTSEVYGDPQVNPQPESYWGNVNPIGPRGVYDEAKRFAEAMTMAYHRSHGLSTRIARIFNTYGPRMRLEDGRAIPNFITQALRSEPLTIYGNGSQTRSFCYIDDLVRGIGALMQSNQSEPVNLGNPEEISIRELAETVLELAESSSAIEECPLPVDDPQVRCPDIGRARRHLDWSPQVSLREGLAPTIAWFRQQVG